jgi:ElaA protein
MNWIIKSFEQLDCDELYKIIRERINVFIVEQECPYSECDGNDRNSYHLYARDEGKIIAYARILKPGISYKETSIGRVLVKENYRGQGLGRKLMEKSLKFVLNEMGEKKVRISAQEYLLDFYSGLGFVKESDTYLEDGIPHIEMLYQA